MTKEQKINEIISLVFKDNVDTFTEVEAKGKIIQAIEDLKSEDEKYKGLCYSVFVNDTKKVKWKHKQHFFKVFWDEIDYLKEEFDLSDSAESLLYRLGKSLKWEMNLLVDDTDYPLNQKKLCEFLNIPPRTFSRNSKELIEKLILLPVCCGKEVYYFMNPHVMYVGSEINDQIPKLFELVGYRYNRNNAREKVKKRGKI
jgi:hypothetical protein